MTRKRQRARSKAKVAIKTPKEDYLAFDSGNDSPPADGTQPWKDEVEAHHHCAESIKAWKFYQACLLERFHWFMDKRKRSIAEDYAHRIAAAWLHTVPDMISTNTAELEAAMMEELEQVDQEERIANRIFRENVKALDEGKSMDELPLIDTRVTSDQVSEFIVKYTSAADDNADLEKETMSLSFSNSTSSQDSGLLMSEQMGCIGLLSDDIWKPDGDIFNGSFTVDQFYQPQLGVEISPAGMILPEVIPAEITSAEVAPAEVTPAEVAPAEVTPAEVAPKEVTPAELVPTTMPESAVEATAVNQPPSIADEDSAIKAVVYSQELPMPVGDVSSAALTKWESSLSQMSTEFQVSTAKLYQPAVEQKVKVNGTSTDKNMARLNTWNEEQTEVNERVAEQQVIKNDDKSAKAPVKFADRKSIGAKDQELVKDILFSWTGESDVEAKVQGSTNSDAISEGNADSAQTNKPLLSFAAVAATAATAPAVKAAPAKTNNLTAEVDPSAVFSTKKPTRKFSKSSCLNKTSMCWAFKQTKKCPWGDECIYAHGKKELRPIPKWFNKEQAANTNSQKIGEAPHAEPCSDHYCRWRRQYLLRKTDLCKLWESGRCPHTSAENCRFAHGSAELKPLPKLELCRLFQKDKCSLKSTECVYAHHPNELRTKNKKKAKKETLTADSSVLSSSPLGRLRTISETSAGSYESSWSSVVGGERVRTISGTSLHSNSSQGMRDLEEFDWLAWNSQSEVPAEEELDESWNEDECVICSHEFTYDRPKHVLECEHDNFHKKCITQWFNRRKTCPMCNNPSDPEFQYEDEQWYLE